MGVSVRFDVGSKVLRASMEGVLTEETLAELRVAVRKLIQSQRADAIIVDLSGVTGFKISTEIVRWIARTPSPGADEIQGVVVAPQDHIYGLTRMFQSYADGIRPNVHVVRSLEEDYRHLGSEYRQEQSTSPA